MQSVPLKISLPAPQRRVSNGPAKHEAQRRDSPSLCRARRRRLAPRINATDDRQEEVRVSGQHDMAGREWRIYILVWCIRVGRCTTWPR